MKRMKKIPGFSKRALQIAVDHVLMGVMTTYTDPYYGRATWSAEWFVPDLSNPLEGELVRAGGSAIEYDEFTGAEMEESAVIGPPRGHPWRHTPKQHEHWNAAMREVAKALRGTYTVPVTLAYDIRAAGKGAGWVSGPDANTYSESETFERGIHWWLSDGAAGGGTYDVRLTIKKASWRKEKVRHGEAAGGTFRVWFQWRYPGDI